MDKIVLIGDIALNGLISEQPEYNLNRLFPISDILEKHELVFANLEVPIKSGNSINQNKKVVLSSDYKVTKDLLSLLNISCVSLANNHIYDYKLSGLRATIDLLDELDIKHTGVGWKRTQVEPLIFNYKNNQKFCYIDCFVINSNINIYCISR